MSEAACSAVPERFFEHIERTLNIVNQCTFDDLITHERFGVTNERHVFTFFPLCLTNDVLYGRCRQ